jgi:hypothetical protein
MHHHRPNLNRCMRIVKSCVTLRTPNLLVSLTYTPLPCHCICHSISDHLQVIPGLYTTGRLGPCCDLSRPRRPGWMPMKSRSDSLLPQQSMVGRNSSTTWILIIETLPTLFFKLVLKNHNTNRMFCWFGWKREVWSQVPPFISNWKRWRGNAWMIQCLFIFRS